jgi:hypothetical protein
MAFEELRGLVKDLASLGRAAIAEFARNDSGKTIAGHLTRAIKEESIKVDNKGIVRPPFPENCVRWTDVLKNWELFLAATEKAEMAASKRERDENSKSGIERE